MNNIGAYDASAGEAVIELLIKEPIRQTKMMGLLKDINKGHGAAEALKKFNGLVEKDPKSPE